MHALRHGIAYIRITLMAVQTPDPQFFAIEVKAVFFKNCIPDTEGDLCFVQKLFSLPELGL